MWGSMSSQKATYDEGNELEDFANEEENREDGENDADPS